MVKESAQRKGEKKVFKIDVLEFVDIFPLFLFQLFLVS